MSVGVAAIPRTPARRRWLHYKKNLARALWHTTTAAVLVVVLFPVYWMVLGTFQPEKDSLIWPPHLFFEGLNFGAVTSIFRDEPLASWIFHSMEVSAVTVSVTVVLVIPGAFLLSQLRWRGCGAFGFLMLFTQLMPGAMIIVPELEWYRTLNWTNNLLALGVLYAAFSVPLGSWILKSAFDSVPNEIIDAGFVDGCTQLGTLRWVLVPLFRARRWWRRSLSLSFASWNDYLFASAFITTRGLYTAGLGMAELGAGYQAITARLISRSSRWGCTCSCSGTSPGA